MKNRVLMIGALLLSLVTAPAFAFEDKKAWVQFTLGTDTWTGERSVMESRDNEWAMFNTSTILWKKSKNVLPPHENVFKYVDLRGGISIVNALPARVFN